MIFSDSDRVYKQYIEYFLKIPKFGDGIGLHRMLWLLEQILKQHPVNFDAIKITGSNGKGSTASMLNSILLQLGEKTGLYTSPHLYRFNERIKIGEDDIGDEDLFHAADWFANMNKRYSAENPGDTIGAFEGFTAIALYHYARLGIQNLVVEAGIGGRYDSTRVIPGKLAALTSLDLEHTDLLGKSLELIAYDKIDICEPYGTLVLGSSGADIMRRIKAYCQLKEINLVPIAQHCTVHSSKYVGTIMQLDLEVRDIRINDLIVSLTGGHQIDNVCTAVILALEWLKHKGLTFANHRLVAAIRNGLKKVHWPGRCKQIHRNPDVYIDVGHSPGAVQAYIDTMKKILGEDDRKVLLVTGVSYDKDVPGILGKLLTIADEVICTRAYHKGSQVSDIESIVKQIKPGIPRQAAGTMEKAVETALEKAARENMVVVIGGGLFLSIEAQTALLGKDPQALRFF